MKGALHACCHCCKDRPTHAIDKHPFACPTHQYGKSKEKK